MENLQEMKKYLSKSGNRGCNYSVGNIIIWSQDLNLTYTIVEETIVFRTVTEDQAIYHVAEYNEYFPEIIQKLSEDARNLKKEMLFADLSAEMKEALEESYPEIFQLEYDRDGSDYVYETADLCNLSGKRYHKKKNHVNRFKKLHDFTYETITPENKQECLDMAAKWRESREMNPSLEAEKKAIELAFQYYEELGFQGGLIRVDGQVMAFTLGEQVTEDTFVTHFEKALDTIPELYAVINQQFAQNQLQCYRYVNREEDLGLEGLRKAKTSYHPAFMVDKYKASLKSCYGKNSVCLWYCSNLCWTA
ncbi:MAG: phosphatidylglycerol lysyltransferase domain-containing protein [Eubacteriales bacterium]|nr:phosphatidylglycerol lysyltransferase domain-containing protein [Eubacteriales bacterium]